MELMAASSAHYGMPVETAEIEAYNERARDKLEEWREKFQSMKSKARKNEVDGVASYRELQRMIQRRIKAAEETVEDLEAAGRNTWPDVRIHMEYAWEALEDTWAHWVASSFNR